MKKLIILSVTNGAGLSSSRYVFEELGYSANDILGEAKKTTKVSYY